VEVAREAPEPARNPSRLARRRADATHERATFVRTPPAPRVQVSMPCEIAFPIAAARRRGSRAGRSGSHAGSFAPRVSHLALSTASRGLGAEPRRLARKPPGVADERSGFMRHVRTRAREPPGRARRRAMPACVREWPGGGLRAVSVRMPASACGFRRPAADRWRHVRTLPKGAAPVPVRWPAFLSPWEPPPCPTYVIAPIPE